MSQNLIASRRMTPSLKGQISFILSIGSIIYVRISRSTNSMPFYNALCVLASLLNSNMISCGFHSTKDGSAADVQLFGYAGVVLRRIAHLLLNWRPTCPISTKPEKYETILFCCSSVVLLRLFLRGINHESVFT